MSVVLESIDIQDIVRNLKRDFKFNTVEETEEKLKSILTKGLLFEGARIKSFYEEYPNPLSKRNNLTFFMECPRCQRRVRKIVKTSHDGIGCVSCCKVKVRTAVKTNSDRILKIQQNFNEIFSKNISKKRKNMLVRNITLHFNSLSDDYKLVYNTLIFKSLQNWCADKMIDKSEDKEYQKAMKDVLEILRNVKKILIGTGLSKSKKGIEI